MQEEIKGKAKSMIKEKEKKRKDEKKKLKRDYVLREHVRDPNCLCY